ncbi:MAG: M1 family aminopeptidase [Bacteroidota bacterium]
MKYFFYILTFSLLVACGSSKDKKSGEIVPEIVWDELQTYTDTAAINLTQQKVFHASETVFTDLIHTKLEVSFDWAKSQLIGVETLTAKPHFYATDSLILDAKGMEIKSVSLAGKNLLYAYDGLFLRIKLDKIYSKNENYTLQISYIAKPEERVTGGSAAITSDKGLYFINPKGEDKSVMPQIWTQGETESSSVWFPTIDAPNVKTTQEIYITVDQKYTTLSNGKLEKSTTNSNGTRTDHWKQDLAHAPYLFMMGVGEFKVIKDSYTRQNGSKMEVNYFVEPEWESSAKAIFGETPAMIKFFSELTGVEYVWDKYHQIVVRDYVSGAMENTGAVIFGDYAYKTERELLDENDNSTIAHELFHHWFGDLVTCESWSNLPLNESFANYSQYLWDEHRYGVDEADYNAENEKIGYYQNAENGGSHNLIWHDYADKEQMFDGHSYNKGGRILHMLRNHLGDEAFFAGLKLYLTTNKFKAAEFHHLRMAFEEVSGQDLNWFFNQWFEAANHPVLGVEQEYSAENKTVTVQIYQNQDFSTTPLYKIPVELIVFDDAGEHKHKVWIEKIDNIFTFPVSGTLKNVLFDNQQCILGKIEETKSQEQFIHQFYNGKRYLARRNALIYGTEKESVEAQKMILDALNDSFWDVRLLAIEKASYLKEQNLSAAIEKITTLVKSDEKSAVRTESLSFLAKNMPASAFEDLCLEVLNKDLSYSVIGTALNELTKKNAILGMQKAKLLENEKSGKMMSTIAQIYAAKGSKENFNFLEGLMNSNKVGGYDGIICLNSFSGFMARQQVDLQEKALPLYKKQYEIGGMYTKMFMPQNLKYLSNMVEESMKESKAKIDAFEKNKDFVEADKIRKDLKKQEMIVADLNSFLAQIEGEAEIKKL